MRIWFALLVAVVMMADVAKADTIRLKNGNVVEGKIIERTPDGIKMDIGGVSLTYYSDEIGSIDGDAQAVDAVAPASSAAAIVPVEPPAVAADMPEAAAAVVPVKPVPVASVVADDLAGMSKDALIRKFVAIYGVKENMQSNFDQMTSTLNPQQAEAFRGSIKVDEIVELLLPIYDKHFTEDDLRAYIRFYDSSEGRRLVQTLPLLMKDSVEISMKYLDSHLPESLKEAETPSVGK